jgi:hypothetical protein
MSDVGLEGRSFKKITLRDLKSLAEIALKDRVDFFQRYPKYKAYANRVICTALCQGAAKHYIDGSTGISDFDVYTFYRKHPSVTWYAKRKKSYDFGNPKFGPSVGHYDFVGRRVDCFGRAIEIPKKGDVITALRKYLRLGATKTSSLLAQKALVLLNPKCGKIVWPVR